MRGMAAAVVLLGAQAAAQCPQITPGAKGSAAAGCTALSSCSDQAPFGLGACSSSIAGGFYCDDFAAYGSDCHACTCKKGCESDGGSGTPQDWRPGATSPYGAGSSADGGPYDLSALQQTNLVAQHNFVRAYHGACPVQWSDAIAQNVKDTAMPSWAQCSLDHTPNSRASSSPGGFTSLGENLASASSMYYANNFPTEMKTMAWYGEEPDWDYATSAGRAGGGSTGHFTQVVWKGTTHVGCAMWQCDYKYGKKVLLACQYGPAGNNGQYAANVGRRGEAATGCTACKDVPSAAPSASPAAAVSPGSTPTGTGSTPTGTGSTPAGSTPAGSTPAGSTSTGTGSTPAGSTSTGTGSTPAGSTPAGSTPTGSTPAGSTSTGTGSTPTGSTPAGSTPTGTGSTPAGTGSTSAGSTPTGTGSAPAGSTATTGSTPTGPIATSVGTTPGFTAGPTTRSQALAAARDPTRSPTGSEDSSSLPWPHALLLASGACILFAMVAVVAARRKQGPRIGNFFGGGEAPELAMVPAPVPYTPVSHSPRSYSPRSAPHSPTAHSPAAKYAPAWAAMTSV